MTLPILAPRHPELNNDFTGTDAPLPPRASTHRTTGKCEARNKDVKRTLTDHPGHPVPLDVYLGETAVRNHGEFTSWLMRQK